MRPAKSAALAGTHPVDRFPSCPLLTAPGPRASIIDRGGEESGDAGRGAGIPIWSRPRSGARESADRDESEPDMTTKAARRDYGLVGPETKRAEAMGLAEAEW